MFTFKNFIKKSVQNDSGIALILVMGVIAILTFLLAEFTFETKLNKIKIYNQQDRIQARLNAEAGLNFAIAKLRLYQEGRNRIEKDDNLKANFPLSELEAIIIQPFIFPFPISSKANIIQRSAADEFFKKIIFHGELSVTISKVSGLLNPNGLRLKKLASTQQVETGVGQLSSDKIELAKTQENDSAEARDNEKKNTEPASIIIEKKMIETFQRLIKDKNDNDEEFHQRYANLDVNYLVQELKFYVNDKGSYQGTYLQEIEAKFNQKNITPKFAPLSSIDELYLLPSWDDAIVDLLKDRLSVHELSVIPVNEITLEDLKVIFPAINNIQIEEFFKYRDGDIDKKIKGKKFKDADDFKRVVTGELNIVTDSEYQERINAFKDAGLIIGTAGKLYKVNSRGSMNNAIYNLIAIIDLPIKEQPKSRGQSKETPKNSNEENSNDANSDSTMDSTSKGPQEEKDKAKPIELLRPRIVEIRLE